MVHYSIWGISITRGFGGAYYEGEGITSLTSETTYRKSGGCMPCGRDLGFHMSYSLNSSYPPNKPYNPYISHIYLYITPFQEFRQYRRLYLMLRLRKTPGTHRRRRIHCSHIFRTSNENLTDKDLITSNHASIYARAPTKPSSRPSLNLEGPVFILFQQVLQGHVRLCRIRTETPHPEP